MFALLHEPSPKIAECELTHQERSPIDFERALHQHTAYANQLRDLGAEVTKLDVNAECPDSVFIEDTAVVFDEAAILCSMGATSRRSEPVGIAPALAAHRALHQMQLPATLEGGDVLRVGRTFLVGQSSRTNTAGWDFFKQTVNRYGYHAVCVEVRGCLHLKSACAALPNQELLINPNWLDTAPLKDFRCIPVPTKELTAANVVLVGDRVLISAAYPQTAELIRSRGFEVFPVDVSEFAKAEGCVTCMSLLLS